MLMVSTEQTLLLLLSVEFNLARWCPGPNEYVSVDMPCRKEIAAACRRILRASSCTTEIHNMFLEPGATLCTWSKWPHRRS
ncbi:hypothetical protein B0H15DRAFT_854473 [Mycena belliarum]|uniref:Secreted protein n=1 Tax=Mycena belliarum TaxID=1033014 RepID=A0AAD6TY43_9AGAR|nr:hypothetical protein B0H15DRAFT_854473 [Mycena belliae]